MDVYKEIYNFTNSSTINLGKWSSIKLSVVSTPVNLDTFDLKVGGTVRASFTFNNSRQPNASTTSFDQRQPHTVSTRNIYIGSDRDVLTTDQIASNIAGAFYSDPSLTSIGFGDGTDDTFSLSVKGSEITIYNNEKKADALAIDLKSKPWGSATGGVNGAAAVGFYKLGNTDNIQPMNAVLGDGTAITYIVADATVNTVNVGPPTQKFRTQTLTLASGIIHPIRTYGASKNVTAFR